jgi:hypothetical protein
MAKKVRIINPNSKIEEYWDEERIQAYQRTYGPVEKASRTATPEVVKPKVSRKRKTKKNG